MTPTAWKRAGKTPCLQTPGKYVLALFRSCCRNSVMANSSVIPQQNTSTSFPMSLLCLGQGQAPSSLLGHRICTTPGRLRSQPGPLTGFPVTTAGSFLPSTHRFGRDVCVRDAPVLAHDGDVAVDIDGQRVSGQHRDPAGTAVCQRRAGGAARAAGPGQHSPLLALVDELLHLLHTAADLLLLGRCKRTTA